MRIVRSLFAGRDLEAWVAASYGLAAPTVTFHSHGDNDNFIVRTGGGATYLLRVYTAAKHWPWGPSDRRFELEWLVSLASLGLPVVAPVRRTDGSFLGSLAAPEGEREAVLFPFSPGRLDPLPADPERLRRLGEGIARIHLASDGFTSRHHRFAIDREFLVEAPLARATAFLAGTGRRAPIAALREVAERVRPAFAALPRTAPAFGVIGGDFHGENHLYTDLGEPVFFDFDLCGFGYRAYDLAVPLWYARREAGTARASAFARPLLAGYETLRPLATAERDALEPLILARQLWLVGEHCADVEAWGEARLGDSYWQNTLRLLAEWKDRPLMAAE